MEQMATGGRCAALGFSRRKTAGWCRSRSRLDVPFELAVGDQEQAEIGTGWDSHSPTLDKSQVLLQPDAARFGVPWVVGLSIHAELFVVEPVAQSETTPSLFQPRRAAPRGIVRVLASDTAPMRVPSCSHFTPKTGIAGKGVSGMICCNCCNSRKKRDSGEGKSSGAGGIGTHRESALKMALSEAGGAKSGAVATEEPKLALLIAVWPMLPQPIKAGILAIVLAATS